MSVIVSEHPVHEANLLAAEHDRQVARALTKSLNEAQATERSADDAGQPCATWKCTCLTCLSSKAEAVNFRQPGSETC